LAARIGLRAAGDADGPPGAAEGSDGMVTAGTTTLSAARPPGRAEDAGGASLPGELRVYWPPTCLMPTEGAGVSWRHAPWAAYCPAAWGCRRRRCDLDSVTPDCLVPTRLGALKEALATLVRLVPDRPAGSVLSGAGLESPPAALRAWRC
jgi:hypothetical protein